MAVAKKKSKKEWVPPWMHKMPDGKLMKNSDMSVAKKKSSKKKPASKKKGKK